MENSTLDMLILLSGEIVLVLTIAIWLLRKKNINLRLELAKILEKFNLLQRKYSEVTNVELSENSSTEVHTDPNSNIEEYIKKALIQSRANLDAANQSTQASDDPQRSLIAANSLRVSILEYELQVISNESSDDDQWPDLIDHYQALLPKIAPAEENIDAAHSAEQKEAESTEFMVLDEFENSNHALETKALEQELGESVMTTSANEINRLRSIMARQYDSIDQLKKSLDDFAGEAGADGSGNNEQMEFFRDKVQLLEHEQEQMAMCITVLDAENLRLKDIISQPQFADRSEMNNDLEADLADDKQQDTSNDNVAELEKDLKETTDLVKNLLQTNKEQLQCITILESENDQLSRSLSEKNNSAGELTSADTGMESAGNKNIVELEEVKLELNAKIAEFELLEVDYTAVKQKYITLFQEKSA